MLKCQMRPKGVCAQFSRYGGKTQFAAIVANVQYAWRPKQLLNWFHILRDVLTITFFM